MVCEVVGGRSSEGMSPVRGGLGRASPIVVEFSDGGCVFCVRLVVPVVERR